DPGLGNGGLGRLAVAFLDSLASLKMPGHGYGLRYEKGLFRQKISKNRQLELPDKWIDGENIWEYKRPEEAYEVRIAGYINISGSGSNLIFNHVNYSSIKAVPYDIPYLGYKNDTVNYLRLWSAEAYEEVDFKEFAKGNFQESFQKLLEAKKITQFLYPDDTTLEGRKLRLIQEYFLVSASMQDLVKTYKDEGLPLDKIYQYRALQINDSHPVLAIPEFMRILVDENEMEWIEAWEITRRTFGFTNHTILSEAMERWDTTIFKEILPRIWMIVEEINYRYLYFLEHEKGIKDMPTIEELSIISKNQVKMVNLAIVGSHSINGVSELHSKILKDDTLNGFYKIYPEKFNNKTNGIVHRRWLLNANPDLTSFLKETIGDGFVSNPWQLEKLLEFKDSEDVLKGLAGIKHKNKEMLAKYILDSQGIKVNPYSIFDVHIKRIHEYKRQLLNVLHILYLYDKLKENPNLDIVPRTFIFGGKAAPGYYIAKEIIRLINTVASIVNNDMSIKDKIKIVFIENYNISKAELLFPAADVSEQISTTTKEASGTGNMKFMMNGAITLATLDGANVEIAREVGEENIVIFGLRSYEVYDYYEKGNYNALGLYNSNDEIKKTVDKLISQEAMAGYDIFPELYNLLTKYNDVYFLLRDFDSYKMAHERIDKLYRDSNSWNKMSLINIAGSGKFSSDNTIKKYADEIWGIKEVDYGS
ncbi:MAG: glycogen/starch/alpha-glucan phosphorylase, partial [Tissierellaceae bacterium]